MLRKEIITSGRCHGDRDNRIFMVAVSCACALLGWLGSSFCGELSKADRAHERSQLDRVMRVLEHDDVRRFACELEGYVTASNPYRVHRR